MAIVLLIVQNMARHFRIFLHIKLKLNLDTKLSDNRENDLKTANRVHTFGNYMSQPIPDGLLWWDITQLNEWKLYELFPASLTLWASPLRRRQEQPAGKSPWQSSNPPPFYPTYREYRSLFAAAWNKKAFAPSSNPKRHLSHIWCDLRTPSIRLNKMAWFTGFPVNAVKSTSGKQGDLCMRESKSTTGIYD